MSDDELETCDKCEKETKDEWLHEITLDSTWTICSSCIVGIEEEIEYNHWQDRYTEEDHQRATDELSDRDEIQCVISDYEDGTIVLHTPYASADIVVDFCRHFGFRITDFHPAWAEESEWPCIPEHGSTFEIVLRYLPDSPMPIHPDTVFTPNRIEDVRKADKQF